MDANPLALPRPALSVRVYGRPAPQGSKRHVGRGIMVEMSRHVKPWREAVKFAALGQGAVLAGNPARLEATFIVDRPQSHYRTGRNAHLLRDGAPAWPATRPDLDKLIRSTLDALKDAGSLADDAQIVDIRAVKVYAGATTGAPGADLRLWDLTQMPEVWR